MAKYTLSQPDANKSGIKLSGVKEEKNPFKTLGEVMLSVSRAGNFIQYTVIRTDFPKCFPLKSQFWNTTDLFCNAMNRYIHDWSIGCNCVTDAFREICFCDGQGLFPIFSKHKIDEDTWKIIIYSQENAILCEKLTEFIDSGVLKLDFKA